jgi:ubiquinone/menaquinone biosynthesis C-methylase UbiE
MTDQSNHPLERNVATFDADVAAHGGYAYTTNDLWSTRYATARQSDELIGMLEGNFSRDVRIADIGCGDGTYTTEIMNRFRPVSIRGIDASSNGIDVARKRLPPQLAGTVSFELGSVYSLESRGEEVAVIRGVLHHLDRPQDAIYRLAGQFQSILVLEPNGFNPVLKLIEKVSAYHRAHDEKSYWPPSLNRWFRNAGMFVVAQKYFCIVPFFFPTPAAKLLSRLEPAFELLPLARNVGCGQNLILYRRTGPAS